MRGVSILAAVAVSAFATGAMAQDGQVIRTGDTGMTCPQIVENANAAATILGGAPHGGVFGSEQAISAATSVAMQGALMSGAGRILPGVGLLGNVAGGLARRDRERREAERLVAQQRWYYLNGLYSGRNCDAVLAQAASIQETQAVPPTQAVPVQAPPAQ